MNVKRWFWNAGDARLRVGWRIAVWVIGLAAVSELLGLAAYLTGDPWRYAVYGLAVTPAAVWLAVVLARRVDRRDPAALGLRPEPGWWRELALGAAFGLGPGAVTLGLLLAGGWARIDGVARLETGEAFWTLIGPLVLYLVGVAVWEELAFRAGFIRNATEGFARRLRPAAAVLAAFAVSTTVFALVHADQLFAAAVHPVLSLGLWLALGALLGLAYLATGRLAAPIGVHLTVNLGMRHLFGLPGDLAPARYQLLRLELTGPEAIVGIGGVAQTVGALVCVGVLLVWWRRRAGGLRVHDRLLPQHDAETGTSAEPREPVGARSA